MATRINLLPWREAHRQQQKRDFVILLTVAAMVAVAGLFLAYLQIQHQIENQQARNTYLRGEIARLKKAEAEIKELDKVKSRLLSRLEIIQNLQASRPGMVKVFDALPRLLPEAVYLSSVKNEGNRLTIKGVASSNNVISNFMRNLAESSEFGEPVLRVVETRELNDKQVSDFELVVNIKAQPRNAEDSEEQS
jgi:type IV pilus assembly protein PilN